jgi:hypothetical protein
MISVRVSWFTFTLQRCTCIADLGVNSWNTAITTRSPFRESFIGFCYAYILRGFILMALIESQKLSRRKGIFGEGLIGILFCTVLKQFSDTS